MLCTRQLLDSKDFNIKDFCYRDCLQAWCLRKFQCSSHMRVKLLHRSTVLEMATVSNSYAAMW
jgi:hypothetical protein